MSSFECLVCEAHWLLSLKAFRLIQNEKKWILDKLKYLAHQNSSKTKCVLFFTAALTLKNENLILSTPKQRIFKARMVIY